MPPTVASDVTDKPVPVALLNVRVSANVDAPVTPKVPPTSKFPLPVVNDPFDVDHLSFVSSQIKLTLVKSPLSISIPAFAVGVPV